MKSISLKDIKNIIKEEHNFLSKERDFYNKHKVSFMRAAEYFIIHNAFDKAFNVLKDICVDSILEELSRTDLSELNYRQQHDEIKQMVLNDFGEYGLILESLYDAVEELISRKFINKSKDENFIDKVKNHVSNIIHNNWNLNEKTELITNAVMDRVEDDLKYGKDPTSYYGLTNKHFS